MDGKMEIFSLGNIDFDCIRKLNLVHLFVINHRCDLSRFGLCSVHSRKVGGSGRRIIWFFHQRFSLYPLYPWVFYVEKLRLNWKTPKKLMTMKFCPTFPNWLVLWLHPMPMTIMICKLTVSPGSQLPPNHAKRFKPQMETVGSAWKCDFPHQKFFFSYLTLINKTGFLKGICNETFLALFPWLKCESFVKCIHCHNIFILWS